MLGLLRAGLSLRPVAGIGGARWPSLGILGAWRTMAYIPPPLAWHMQSPKEGYMPRAEKITVHHIGSSFLVHSGRDHKRVKVTAQMVAHKFGEFVMTRKLRRPQKKVAQKGKKKR